jgi:hypothetical protein
MVVQDLINVAQQVKQKYPVMDPSQFRVTLNGEEVGEVKLDLDHFTFELHSSIEEINAEPVNGDLMGEQDL